MQLVDPNAPPDPRQALVSQLAQQFPMTTPLGDLMQQALPRPQPPGLGQRLPYTQMDQPPREQPTPASTITSWSQPAPGQWRPPYIPVRPRSAREAGGDWWPISGAQQYPGADAGPMLPSPREAIGVMGHAGRYLQQWGSPSVSPFMGRASQMAMQLAPILDMLSKGAFSKNYMQARMGQFKLMQDEMLLNAQMGLQQHQKELMDYSDVFRAFDAGALGATPEANAQEAHRQLEELAQTHPNLLAILKNKGVGAMERAVQAEDNQYRNMYAGYTSAKKARDDAREDPSATDEGGGDTERREDPLALHPDIKALGPVADATGATPATTDSTDYKKTQDDIAKKSGNINASAMEAARQLAAGKTNRKAIEQQFSDPNKVIHASTLINNGIREAAISSTDTPEEKLKKIANISPEQAATYRGLINYDEDPRTFSKRSDHAEEVLARAQMIDPDYKPQLYDLAKEYSNMDKPLGARMNSVARMSTATLSVLRELKNFKENEVYPARWAEQVAAGKWTGDDKYPRLYQALVQYASAAGAVQSGSPRVPVTVFKTILSHMSDLASPSAIRGQMQIDNNDSFAIVQEADARWKERTGKSAHIPGFPGRPAEIIDAYRRSDAHRGVYPEDAPDELKAVMRAPGNRVQVPGRPLAGRPSTPLTEDQISKAKEFIEKYKNGTEEEKRQVQQLREWIY
jgi:hypothetical protein